MTQEELFQLFEKYIRGEASPVEAAAMLSLIGNQEADVLMEAYLKAYRQSAQELPASSERMDRIYQTIQQKIAAGNPQVQEVQGGPDMAEIPTADPVVSPAKGKRRWLARLAAAVIIVAVAISVYFLFENSPATKQTDFVLTTAQQEAEPTFKKFVKTGSYTENLQLADQSRVVMRAGSQLGITRDFNTTKRTVFLDGEAFFDITHNDAKPFFIHTGPLTIEVLGTAFNIKSFSGQDSAFVSVTRGKVLVWDKARKLKQVLTAHQSISYLKDKETYQVQAHNPDEDRQLAWVAKDMTFDGLSMREVIARLSRRYQVRINASDSALLETKVKISFIGTEPLANVLEALSLITGSAYTLQGDTVAVFKKTTTDHDH